MADVEICNSNLGITHPFSLRTMRTGNLMTHFMMPQDVNMKDREGNTLLHIAVTSDDIGIVELILKTGTSINESRMDGMTPLHMAIESEQEENVKILLDYGARIDAKDLFGRTPLHLIASINYRNERKMLRIAELILDRGTDVKVNSF